MTTSSSGCGSRGISTDTSPGLRVTGDELTPPISVGGLPAWQHLDKEVEKVVLFFLATQGDIAARLLDLRVRMKGLALTKDVEPPEPPKQQLVSPGGKVGKVSTSPVRSPWTSDSPLRMIRTDGR